MRQDFLLLGAGGHGRVVAKQIHTENLGSVCFADDNLHIGALVDGVPVVDRFDSAISKNFSGALLVTLGCNEKRRTLHSTALKRGVPLGQFCSAGAFHFSDFPYGEGCQVLAGTVVNCGAKIGRSVILNTHSVVEHDAVVEDFCHVGPGAIVGSGAQIGTGVFLGMRATILPRLSIAPNCVIGAGAVVTKSIEILGTYIGAPAQRME